MKWPEYLCNLSFVDYRSLLCLTGSLLIKYNFAAPLACLILHQNLLHVRLYNLHPSIHFHTCTYSHTSSQLKHLYIYLLDYQVGSNNLSYNYYYSRLEIINICKLENPFTGLLYSVNSVQKIIPVLTDWAWLIQRTPWQSFDYRENSVSTEFPEMTEWARWKLPFGDRVKLD